MKITLKDGKILEFQESVTVRKIAETISEGLAKAAICGKVGKKLLDLETIINEDCAVSIITEKDPEYLEVLRHTASHVLAHAVKNLYPTCKLAIGPAIATGFYYDFEFQTPITMDDFPKIEQEMAKIIKADMPIVRFELPRKDATKLMKDFSENYKVELIKGLPPRTPISFYKLGEFTDLCAGPHLKSTGLVKAFKLMSLTGAYWKGNENNTMLTRIYATAFEKQSDLEAHLIKVEEAKKRDHNKLGRELGYFMTDENIGQGLPLLMPKGAKLFQILSRWIEDEEERRGYVLTRTPYLAKSNLYKVSGHWDHYKEKMFIINKEENSDEILALRPMTCPFQYTIYKNGIKSYKDLPVRYSETSKLFRKEASGEMHGLIRIREFTLSDAHIVCMPNQLEEEFKQIMDLIYYILESLGLRNDVSFRLSLWDPKNTEKYINNPEAWESSQNTLRQILNHLKIDYVEAKDEAAFYGPKLDIQCYNVHGKEDTIITVQIDFALAERFDMEYIDEKGVKQRPFIIHRSSIGCYERTIAMLIEKYAGALPLWLSPVQVRLMSLTDRTIPEINAAKAELLKNGIRVDTDLNNEKVGYKIRQAQLEKIPYMVIIGDKDKEAGVVSVRSRKDGDIGTMKLADFIAKIKEENDTKKLN